MEIHNKKSLRIQAHNLFRKQKAKDSVHVPIPFAVSVVVTSIEEEVVLGEGFTGSLGAASAASWAASLASSFFS